jgi:ABC-2 type transport system ATP-binding protein
MNGDSIIIASHLGKRYRKRWAVRDLNLTVRAGEIFGFLGPNGAGKSTTIRMLLSLIAPTQGSVELFGRPLRKSRREVLQRVGGLVERPDFYLYLSARRNLEVIGSLRGGASRRAIDDVLDTVGLLARADDKVKTFSHGMKQRLGIAQALLGGPELVVLDEPTSGLDPQGIKEVRELIQQLSHDRSMTIFLSSHLLSEIEQTATSMAIINRGSLVVQGIVKELLAEHESLVRIEADPLDSALGIVREIPGTKEVRLAGERIECTMPRTAIPDLTRRLVSANVNVRALVPKRSLEEYFLSITEGASDVTSTRTNRSHRNSAGQ